ncbi:MAG TPA: HEAT repeat domain-containing protein [Vicinamibacterales bacterium]|nr:HEAT repeat domain-containing protein [Vicinamibacterales bacterium]
MLLSHCLALLLAGALAPAPAGRPQAPAANATPLTAQQLRTSIAKLGAFDDRERTDAARAVRRAPAAQAVPALMAAAEEHPDGYVRFRALVILSGFHDPRARDVMVHALDDPNDRLRTVAYTYFEHNPDPAMVPRLLKALDKEEGEFVRPALTRTLAAYAADPRVRDVMPALVMSGQDLFRSAVIEAVGDYRVTSAFDALRRVATLDGPLQEDAVLALGKLGDKRALAVLEPLQQSAPRERQPAIAAAICLLGVNCESHQGFLVETLTFAVQHPGFQDLLRAATRGLAALAVAGHQDAAVALIDAGVPARDPARSPIALAFGTVALRNTPLALKLLESRADRHDAALLLRDAFDMLEEDYEEERFYAAVRRAYWASAPGSLQRRVTDALIQVLEF